MMTGLNSWSFVCEISLDRAGNRPRQSSGSAEGLMEGHVEVVQRPLLSE